MGTDGSFKIGFSADFLNEQRRCIFPDIGLSLLASEPRISYEFLKEYRAEYEPSQLADYDVLITMRPQITRDSLRGVTRLCAIGRCGVGYDNVDLAACTDHDVAVYITPEGVIHSMAESIVLFVLALSHNLVIKDRLMREGLWTESSQRLGREPRDRTIGTIGLGNIAREAVRMVRSFGAKRFLGFDPFVKDETFAASGVIRVTLEDLLRQSDYVLVNCPLTPKTRHLLGEKELKLMKPTAVLVNTARGPIVDQAALIAALSSRTIAGAALDVFDREPLESDSPLLGFDNVILTSHSVGWTEELFRDMGTIDCQGALNVCHGLAPASVVNREVLDRAGFKKKLEAYARQRVTV